MQAMHRRLRFAKDQRKLAAYNQAECLIGSRHCVIENSYLAHKKIDAFIGLAVLLSNRFVVLYGLLLVGFAKIFNCLTKYIL